MLPTFEPHETHVFSNIFQVFRKIVKNEMDTIGFVAPSERNQTMLH